MVRASQAGSVLEVGSTQPHCMFGQEADLGILIRSDAEGLRGRALGKGADIIVDAGRER